MARGHAPLPLVVLATLHCGVVLGQDAPATAPTPAAAPEPDASGTGARAADGSGPPDAAGGAPRCLDALAATGATFTLAPAEDEPQPLPGCGLRDGVVVSRGPAGIQYRPPIRVSCAFALELPEVERVVQQAATEHLGAPIDVARTMGSFGCRTIQSARSPGRMSEHGVGNAVDIGEWWSRDLRAVVLRDFRRDAPEGAFLRALASRLRACPALERLLDPDYDAAHRNHFHLEGHPLRPAVLNTGR